MRLASAGAICSALQTSCGANRAAQNLCATAHAAALAAPNQTGAQADAFNAAFGISTVSRFLLHSLKTTDE